MNVIEYSKPFEFMWKGLKMQAHIQSVEVEQSFDEPSRLNLECVVVPYIDNKNQNTYNKGKGETMFCGSGLDGVIYTPDKYTWTEYKTFNNEEDNMSIAKKYANKNRDKKLQKAIEKGLIGEDGVLTCEGKALLLQILLDDKEIKNKFFDAVEELSEDEEK